MDETPPAVAADEASGAAAPDAASTPDVGGGAAATPPEEVEAPTLTRKKSVTLNPDVTILNPPQDPLKPSAPPRMNYKFEFREVTAWRGQRDGRDWLYGVVLHTTNVHFRPPGQPAPAGGGVPSVFFCGRQFTDFEWLREALACEQPGAVVPPLPPLDFQLVVDELEAIWASARKSMEQTARELEAKAKKKEVEQPQEDDAPKDDLPTSVVYRKAWLTHFLLWLSMSPKLHRTECMQAFMDPSPNGLAKYQEAWKKGAGTRALKMRQWMVSIKMTLRDAEKSAARSLRQRSGSTGFLQRWSDKLSDAVEAPPTLETDDNAIQNPCNDVLVLQARETTRALDPTVRELRTKLQKLRSMMLEDCSAYAKSAGKHSSSWLTKEGDDNVTAAVLAVAEVSNRAVRTFSDSNRDLFFQLSVDFAFYAGLVGAVREAILYLDQMADTKQDLMNAPDEWKTGDMMDAGQLDTTLQEDLEVFRDEFWHFQRVRKPLVRGILHNFAHLMTCLDPAPFDWGDGCCSIVDAIITCAGMPVSPVNRGDRANRMPNFGPEVISLEATDVATRFEDETGL